MERVACVLLWLVVLHTATASLLGVEDNAGNADGIRNQNQGPANTSWFKVTIQDNIMPGNKTIDGYTNAELMSVFASRFNYSTALRAIKVMIRGNLDKPSPSVSDPLVASIRNWAGGHTITVPYNVYNHQGQLIGKQDHATRYLCPAEPGQQEHAIVSVGTAHMPTSEKFHFQVSFQRVGHFSLLLDMPEQLEVQPTDPGLFEFRWPTEGPSEVLMSVTTVQSPDICTTVSLQPRVCPLAQTPEELATISTYFTITSSGELTVHRQQFPDGFYLLLLPRFDDVLCDREAPEVTNNTRKKTMKVTLSEHQLPVSLLAAPAVLAVVLLVIGAASVFLLRRDLTAPRLDMGQEDEERPRRGSLTLSEDLLLDGTPEQDATQQAQEASSSRSPVSLLLAAGLLLFPLGGEALLTALRALHLTGDLDVCYRNEQCTLTSGGVPGLNHVLARLPYVGAGLGLLVAVRAQKGIYARVTIDGTIKIGAPHEWGLLDVVALAMVLHGVFSALQSTCPGPANAPLDVALVYFSLTALACKLFQTRRGQRAAGHYAPLLLTSALVLAGLVKQRAGDAWYVWLVLVSLHLIAALVIGVQLYVLGEVTASPAALRQVWQKHDQARESTYFTMNRVTLAITLLANVALGVAAATSKISDFSHYAMLFFAIHAVLYALYYLLLKMGKHQESGGKVAPVLLALGLILLIIAVATLTGWSTFSTGVSPASSRLLGRPCIGHGLFDTHDLWHLMAAPALLFLALSLLLLDDNLLLTPRQEIPRF